MAYNPVLIEQYNNEFDNTVYHYEVDGQISDNTDLIMFLKEGEIDTGELCFSDDYQFNGFYICGSDLIDIVKAYNL